MDPIEKLIDKRDDEEIIFFIRRHFIPLVFSFSLGALFVLLPFFLMFFLFQYGMIGLLVFFALLLISILYLLRLVIIWYNSVFVITDKRVVDVTQKGFFDQSVSEAAHHHVTDVYIRKQGVFQHLFNYGTITIQTWSTTLELKDVYRPIKVQQRILTETRLDRTADTNTNQQGQFGGQQKKKTTVHEEEKPVKLEKEEVKKLIKYMKDHVDKDILVEELFGGNKEEKYEKKRVKK